MIDRMTALPPGIDGVRASGQVTREDYDQVFVPLLDEARAEGRRLRFLYQFGPDFTGFTPGAAWQDARLGLQNLRLFERCAIVTDLGWIRQATRVVRLLMPCPVRVFSNAELEQATAWLAEAALEPTLGHELREDTGVLVLEPHEALRAEDIDAVAAEVDPWIETHGELHGIVVHAHEFPGWENLDSLMRHLRFIRDHQRRVSRIALAADSKLASLAPRLAQHFVAADIKQFAYDGLEAAIAWAGEEAPPEARPQ
jgi:hypothetical protein